MRILTYKLLENQTTKDIIGADITKGYIKLERTIKELPINVPVPCVVEFNEMFNIHYSQSNMVRIDCLDSKKEPFLRLWTKLSYLQLQRLKYIIGVHWIVKDRKWIIGMIVSFFSGLFISWLTCKC